MSSRPTRPTNRPARRLERRSEREARQPAAAPRPRRQRDRRQAARRPGGGGINLVPVLIFIGVLAIAAVLVYAVASANNQNNEPPGWLTAQLDDSVNLPGVYYKPHPGFDGVFTPTVQGNDDRLHVATGVDIPVCTDDLIAADVAVADLYADRSDIADCYHSNPPTSGPHADQPAQFKVWENEAPKENLVHSMEHGAVIIWYNTDDQAVIDQLAEITNAQLDRRRLLVMSRYSGMEPDTIALTAWTRLDKFSVSEFSEERVMDFIDTHQRRFNPEGF
jgi:hypothetical protein